MKTYAPKEQEIIRKWYLADLKGKILGRTASKIACVLRGKNKSIFSPNVDCGDFVIAVNVKHVKLTGNKLEDKKYRHHTKYPGGLKETSAGKMLEKKPEYVILHAVKGMIPNNKLRDEILKRLKIYPENIHPHESQKPELISL